MTALRSLLLLVVAVGITVPASAQSGECPPPFDPSTVQAVCGIDGVEGERVGPREGSCNWVYMRPGEGTRTLTVLRTTTPQTAQAQAMTQLSSLMGGSGAPSRSLPDLGDGGQSHTQSLPGMSTTHVVTFTQGQTFVELKAAGTTDMRGSAAAAPFCTRAQVETLAREVAGG